MMIVVEGCDGVGKTTFIEKISARIGPDVDLRHCGPPERHPLEEYVLDVEGYQPGRGEHLVYDRLHWGEMIYGPLYRGKSELGRPGRDYVDLVLKARGAVVVYIRPSDPREHAVRLYERGEDYLRPNDVHTVVKAYDDVYLDRRALGAVVITGYPMEADVDRVLEHARYQETRAIDPRAEPHPPLVGDALPRILLLGDERARTREELDRPEYRSPFVPYPDTSGRYLMTHLPDDVIRSCAIANATEDDVRALWDRLNRPRVVALGRKAERECLRAKVPHGAVPHPQYVRRFHYSDGKRYGDHIREAAVSHDDLTIRWTRSVT